MLSSARKNRGSASRKTAHRTEVCASVLATLQAALAGRAVREAPATTERARSKGERIGRSLKYLPSAA